MEFKVPELGENIHSGDVVNVLVREGQTIEANQGILELETDKAVIELPCPHAGTIGKIHVKKGDTVKVGQTLLTLTSSGAEATAASPAAAEPAPAAEGPTDGEAAEAPAAESTATPPEARTTAQAAPVPEPPPMPPEQRLPPSPGISPATGAAPARRPDSPAGNHPAPLPAGPAARRAAREKGVDLAAVQGSGSRGRITVEDVESAAQGQQQASPAAPAPARSAPAAVGPAPVVPEGESSQDSWGPVVRQKMPAIRRAIAQQMARSATTIPHVTNFDDADITDLDRLRKNVPANYLGADVKLTSMPFVIKAVAAALLHHPLLNSSLDEENQQIVYKQYVHLGIAVDTPRGLIVPVMRNVDRLGIPEIARDLAVIAQRARQAQFAIEDLRGGTFTLSNMGAVGGTYSTPIINHPEVAVLLIGRSRWLPVVRDEKIEPRFLMPLSLSYDHRLVDGAAAARFLNEVIDYLQSPGKLLLT